jgi:formylglycine-generating enzyme required for sulfatase activity
MGFHGTDAPTNDGYSYKATVSGYSLDRFEVTVGRFRRFVEAYDDLLALGLLPEGAGANPNVAAPAPGTGWRKEWEKNLPASRDKMVSYLLSGSGLDPIYTPAPGEKETSPIMVDWYLAFAFCVWDGGRLPTEAEWEMAASNGAAQTRYPWGDSSPTSELAHFSASMVFHPTSVGSQPLGSNLLGHRDLAGNVSEWVLDAFAPYPNADRTDYANVTFHDSKFDKDHSSNIRVFRGGTFFTPASYLTASSRNAGDPSTSGMRCARTP